MTATEFPEPGITGLERIAAAHWRGTEEEWLGQWLLRAADGFTGRANSVLPLGDPGLPLGDAIDYVTRWYAARGLRPMFALPAPLDPAPVGSGSPAGELDAELVRRSWPERGAPAFVMVADIDGGGLPPNGGQASTGQRSTGRATLPAGLEFCADPVPDEAWLATYHYRGGDSPPPVARSVLTSAAGQVFLSIRSGDDVAAIARLSLAEGWAGIAAVEVAKTHRRAGLGGALTREAFAQAAARGVHRVFLQVEVGNHPAKALYERSGFRYAHRYHYRLAPAPGALTAPRSTRTLSLAPHHSPNASRVPASRVPASPRPRVPASRVPRSGLGAPRASSSGLGAPTTNTELAPGRSPQPDGYGIQTPGSACMWAFVPSCPAYQS